MSPAYKILGMSVKPHILAIGTLAATGAGVYFGLGSNGQQEKGPVASDSVRDGEEINVEEVLKEFLGKDSNVEEK
ncbi:hypothetical protein HG536_0A06280 [Torulaspora globosa]|uniref:Uncharacterized protein n=1 Tax=Torulaspora globosa TaxID=48254 RepID=A0A7G3ZBC7_9SACH|nr:uncharacterized protein HG536_0A06280 [Torulaspora globosa]QLL30813.1 hypothetical protein HG536_0A06280 [Torulaspora globosa]